MAVALIIARDAAAIMPPPNYTPGHDYAEPPKPVVPDDADYSRPMPGDMLGAWGDGHAFGRAELNREDFRVLRVVGAEPAVLAKFLESNTASSSSAARHPNRRYRFSIPRLEALPNTRLFRDETIGTDVIEIDALHVASLDDAADEIPPLLNQQVIE